MNIESSRANQYGVLGALSFYVEKKQEEVIKTIEGQTKQQPLSDVSIGDLVIKI